MSFSYKVTLSDPNKVGAADAVLVYDLQQALSVWSQYITGLGTLVVALNIENTNEGRESGGPTSSFFVGTNSGLNVFEPSSLYELTTGNHVSGTTSDITISIDPGYFHNLDLAANLTYSSQVPSNEYNPIVVFLHELEHGFGMTGWYSQTGVLPGNYESTFDKYIKITSSGDFFTGPNAEAVYGGPVLLTSSSTAGENYYHFGNTISDITRTTSTVHDPLTLDLMNGIVFFFDYQYPISPLDLAVLKDLGYNVTNPATTATIQADYLAITRAPLSIGDATTVVNAISTGTQTEAKYVDGLLAQVATTTIPAIVIEASMYGKVGSSAEVTSLATQYLPPQVAEAAHFGFNAQVFATEALGLVFAFNDENGGTAFATNWGPNNAQMPNTAAGDAAFASAAAATIFGSAEISSTPGAILAFVNNWKAFFSVFGIPGNPHPTSTQVDLAARGTAWGDAVGIALANNLGLLPGQVTNFLKDAAQGTAIYSTSLASQPDSVPFQGSAVPRASDEAQMAQLVGVPDQPEQQWVLR